MRPSRRFFFIMVAQFSVIVEGNFAIKITTEAGSSIKGMCKSHNLSREGMKIIASEALSVGEVISAKPLVKALRKEMPGSLQ